MLSLTDIPSGLLARRFTLDGSEGLERHLAQVCCRTLDGVGALIAPRRLEALVLGGGYGRGEGGVLKTDAGDRPYNDLEFYVFVRGNRSLNDLKYRRELHALAEGLSPTAGVQVEFKIDSLGELRRCPVSMFSYDLIAGHRTLFGGEEAFRGCEQHLEGDSIPLVEATRLLLNRGTGLLLVRELLRGPELTTDQADFIGRNLAKAQLALGDAVLAAFRQYHWSCLERHRRLAQLVGSAAFLDSQLSTLSSQLLERHAAGVEFKLHPYRCFKPATAFAQEHREVSRMALQLWLWLEGRRFGDGFSSARAYAFSRFPKCVPGSAWRNWLLNVRSFGLKGAVGAGAGRYPRERLLRALPLLLWQEESVQEPEVLRHLQRQLLTDASGWPGLVQAYKKVWSKHG